MLQILIGQLHLQCFKGTRSMHMMQQWSSIISRPHTYFSSTLMPPLTRVQPHLGLPLTKLIQAHVYHASVSIYKRSAKSTTTTNEGTDSWASSQLDNMCGPCNFPSQSPNLYYSRPTTCSHQHVLALLCCEWPLHHLSFHRDSKGFIQSQCCSDIRYRPHKCSAFLPKACQGTPHK